MVKPNHLGLVQIAQHHSVKRFLKRLEQRLAIRVGFQRLIASPGFAFGVAKGLAIQRVWVGFVRRRIRIVFVFHCELSPITAFGECPLTECDGPDNLFHKFEYAKILSQNKRQASGGARMASNKKRRGKSVAYETTQTLINLALYLQTTRIGKTVEEMQRELNCSRATVYRWLESLGQIPGLEPERRRPLDSDRPNQWRWAIKPKNLPIGVAIEPRDLVDLGSAIDLATSNKQRDRFTRLRAKIEALAQEQGREKAEVTIETRLTYRGAMIRTGLRYEADDRWLQEVERALARNRMLRLTFKNDLTAIDRAPWVKFKDGASRSSVVVRPIGVIAEKSSYLIAAGKKLDSQVRAYSFDDISRVSETMLSFDSSDLPTLDQCAREGRGIHEGKTKFEAFVQFVGARAEEVQRLRFHPDQIFELYYMPTDSSGGRELAPSLRFFAWDQHSLALELLSFGPRVIVVSPQSLGELHFSMLSRFYEATEPGGKFDFSKLYRD